MTLIDDRGRLVGRVNLIDAGVGLLIVLLAAGLFVGYRLLRLPVAPVVTTVEPRVQQGGVMNMRLVLKGQNFLPFMRVFVQRSDQAAKPLTQLDPESSGLDQFVLVNYSQGRFFAESPQLAEVWLPDKLGAGTYDLVFFSETQIVAVKRSAFQLTEPPPPPPQPPGAPRANVRVYGAFVALDRANPPRLAPGVRLPTGLAEPWAEILEVQPPRPETAQVRAPSGDFQAEVPARMQVPAVLRVHCVVEGLNCGVAGANIIVGRTYPIRVGDKSLAFSVQDMGPDAAEVVRAAVVDVRFFAKPEIAALVHPNDVELSKVPDTMRLRRSAVLRSRSAAEETSVMLTQSDTAQSSFQVEGKVVAFNARLAMPLMQTPTGWFYRSQPVKAGVNLVFETSAYSIRGLIVNVAFPAGTPSTRSATP